MPNSDALDIVEFWRNAGHDKWFGKDDSFDEEFRSRFNELHKKAAAGDLSSWLADPQSSLALILLLDQFPRNCFRGSPRMYETDALARDMARRAIAAGHPMSVEEDLRGFFYLPFSHSEHLVDHTIAVEGGRTLPHDFHKHARGHQEIIRRFGRFPHRNEILGRQTTPDERKFLDDGGFAG